MKSISTTIMMKNHILSIASPVPLTDLLTTIPAGLFWLRNLPSAASAGSEHCFESSEMS
jgi:pyrroline-5-carboxylate reductase